MGVFFKADRLRDAIVPAIANALTTDPSAVSDPNQTAARQADQIAAQVKGTFSWPRLLLALALLTLLVFGAAYTGQKPELKALYDVLVHALEIGFGGVFGLLVGEASARG